MYWMFTTQAVMLPIVDSVLRQFLQNLNHDTHKTTLLHYQWLLNSTNCTHPLWINHVKPHYLAVEMTVSGKMSPFCFFLVTRWSNWRGRWTFFILQRHSEIFSGTDKIFHGLEKLGTSVADKIIDHCVSYWESNNQIGLKYFVQFVLTCHTPGGLNHELTNQTFLFKVSGQK